MQTFLPYTDFKECAKCLDYKRLGKQRSECKQILNALNPNTNSRWKNHPAVRMWKGHELVLKYYMNCMIKEWVNRGYKNNMELNKDFDNITIPDWIDIKLIYSHRANLLRKQPQHYNQFNWNVDPEAPYWWPSGLKTKNMDKKMREYYNNFNKRISE